MGKEDEFFVFRFEKGKTMRPLFCWILLCAFAIVWADKPKVVVLPFVPQSEMAQKKVESFTTILANKLMNESGLEVLPPLLVSHHYEQIQVSLKTGNPYSVALELGKRLQVDWILVSSMVIEEGYSSLNILLIDGRSGAQVKSYRKEGSDQIPSLLASLEEMAQKIVRQIQPHERPHPKAQIPVEITDHFIHAERYFQQGNVSEALKHIDSARQKGTQYLPVLQDCLSFYQKFQNIPRVLETLTLILQNPESHQQAEVLLMLIEQFEQFAYGIQAEEALRMWLALPQNARSAQRSVMLAKQEELKKLSFAQQEFQRLQDAFNAKNQAEAWRLYDEIQKHCPTHPWLTGWEKDLKEKLPRKKTFYQSRLVLKNNLNEEIIVYAVYAVKRDEKWIWFPNEKKPFWWKLGAGQSLAVNDDKGQPIITHSALIWAESTRKNYAGYPLMVIETHRYTPVELAPKEGYQDVEIQPMNYTFFK